MNTYLLRKAIRRLPGKVIHLVPMPRPAIVEGLGVRNRVGECCRSLGLQRVLLVTDKKLCELGLHMPVETSLRESGVDVTLFSGIDGEPTLDMVDAGRKAAWKCGAEGLVALGGGSVMDSSKMIAAGVRFRHLSTRTLQQKFLVVRGGSLPMITIPTTAGTGAELTVGALTANPRSGSKHSTVIAGLDIRQVFLDGELTLKTPRSVTAACGIDALSHGLEGCVAAVKSSSEDVDKSRECVRLVLENLPRVLDHPDDGEARQCMCRAACLGGNAINKQLAGYVHAFAHTIGAVFHISHGQAIALSLVPVMRHQKSHCLQPLAELSRYCQLASDDTSDELAADSILEAVEQLIRRCDLSTPQVTLNDRTHIINLIAADSINYSAPVTFTNQDISTILDIIFS